MYDPIELTKMGDYAITMDRKDLVEFMRENFNIRELYNEADFIEYINDTLYPEEVFPAKVLHNWALENGYSK